MKACVCVGTRAGIRRGTLEDRAMRKRHCVIEKLIFTASQTIGMDIFFFFEISKNPLKFRNDVTI